jgi:inhibitor of the pro-sigma K processing machinery
MPIKLLFKLIINSLLGIFFLYAVNFIGSYFGFHIGINVVTILITAILGIPGIILLTIIGL